MNSQGALTYIDLFAGCGGLSLGLHQAGWKGILAVERSPMAFETLRHNLIDSGLDHFPHWPTWFPKEACSIQKFTKTYRKKLQLLQGKVMLIAGGPPCQGFSFAGKRRKHDHRNQLYKSYLEVVGLVRPALVLIENVAGITSRFSGISRPGKRGRPQVPYSERIKKALEKKFDYDVCHTAVLASDFGVPQARSRFVAVGIDRKQFADGGCPFDPDDLLARVRETLLSTHGLPIDRPVSSREALSDLEYDSSNVAACPDSKTYESGRYRDPSNGYQLFMRRGNTNSGVVDSHRFVKHQPRIIERFCKILESCPRGKNLPKAFRKQHRIKKTCIVPLDPERPASTLTTIPDDMIHYSQPRVLTVRECARLQSFPDWFAVKSKYTTGGRLRKAECPRYTQIGNAVPPLLAEALGRALALWIDANREANPARPQCPNDSPSARVA